MVEQCSSTEFSAAADFYIKCKTRTVRDRYSLLLASKKKKSCATNNTGRKEQYIRHSLLNHRHRQSTEVFECHKNTVTRQTSLQRRRRRLFGKHCSNFVFPVKTKTLGPVCLGCEGCRCIRSLVDIHYDAFLQLEQTRDKKYIQKTCLGLSLVKCTEGFSIF